MRDKNRYNNIGDPTTNKKLFFIFAIILGVGAATFVLVMFNEVRTSGEQVAASCSNGRPVHTQVVKSKNPQLKKLAQYEILCKGAVVDQLMIFLPMPTTTNEADSAADDAAASLKEFARYNIMPLVLFEPSLTNTAILRDIHAGRYDDILARYYQRLKSSGLTDAQLGTWVLFPEANTPTWDITDPALFQANVIKVATFQKRVFPSSHVSILLNSRTYPNNDASWNNGEMKSLEPYINRIPRGLLDSFGYQGFPSQSPANATSAYSWLRPSQFLPIDIAQQALTTLGLKKIWFNTGTYATMYANDPTQIVYRSTAQRQKMLQGILAQAQKIRDAKVTINIFAEDKADTSEAVDWSYWHGYTPTTSSDARALADFIAKLKKEHMTFSLYDTL